MDARPKNIVRSSALALVAAVGSMVMAFYSITVQDLYATGAFLGLGVMLLAYAGGFMEGTQWTWELTMAAGVFIMVFGLAAILLEAASALAVLLILLAVLISLVSASDDNAKYWYLYDRI